MNLRKTKDVPRKFVNKIEEFIISQPRHSNDVVAELSKETGIPTVTLWHYRKNKVQPKVEAALKIASFFGATVEDLFIYSTHKTVSTKRKPKHKSVTK